MSKTKRLVGLDVETGSIAATEVQANGHAALAGHGLMALDAGVFREGEVADAGALADALKELFAEQKLSRTVRLGVANQRVAVRTIRLPRISEPAELETAIRFQAQDHIPMPLEQAVLDWQVVPSRAEGDGEAQMDVVVVAARRDMVEGVLEATRRAGLRLAGIDHSAFGMIRALTGEPGSPAGAAAYVQAPAALEGPGPAKLFCNLADITNLAVVRDATCLFTRISSFGMEGIAQLLAERRKLTLEHARQWLTHVGLEAPVESIEGDPEMILAARSVLDDGVAKLAEELRLSLDYYRAQEGALPVDGVLACGLGTTVPGLVAQLGRDLGQPFEVARPRALDHLDAASAARLTLSYGLALEG